METDAWGTNGKDWDLNQENRNNDFSNKQLAGDHVFYVFAQESDMPEVTKAMEYDISSLTPTMQNLGFTCLRINVKNNFSDVKLNINNVAKLDHKNATSFVCAMFLNSENAWYAQQEISILNSITTPFNVRNCSSLAGKAKIFIFQLYPPKEVYLSLAREDTVDSIRKKKKDSIPLEADFLIVHSNATYAKEGSHFAKALSKTLSLWGANIEVVKLMTKVNSLTVVYQSNDQVHENNVPSMFCRLRESHILKNGTKKGSGKLQDKLPFRKYDMTNGSRGIFLIFNHEKFPVDVKDRPGTDRDEEKLVETMTWLGFHCKVYNNLEKKEIISKIKNVSKLDHSQYKCFGCAILTHGGDNDMLLTSDNQTLTVKDFTDPFTIENCPTLKGKPKLFFLQVCRGYNYDVGNNKGENDHRVAAPESDYDSENNFIETEKDFLISQSTTSDYFSWRDNRKGSLYIRALCEEIKAHAKKQDLVSMLTQVNQKVSQINIPCKDRNSGIKHIYKQMPSFCSRLTREIYFFNTNKKQLKETAV